MPEPSSHHSTKAMDEGDIRAVIDNGMPGTAMPGWTGSTGISTTERPKPNKLLKKVASCVLASRRGSTYGTEYASPRRYWALTGSAPVCKRDAHYSSRRGPCCARRLLPPTGMAAAHAPSLEATRLTAKQKPRRLSTSGPLSDPSCERRSAIIKGFSSFDYRINGGAWDNVDTGDINIRPTTSRSWASATPSRS